MRSSLSLLSIFFLLSVTASSLTLHVPADFNTVQEAIDAAGADDLILVADGTYFENLDFQGKKIVLKSERGPEACIIDGCMNGSVVTFAQGEGRGSVLEGFTITNGSGKTFCDSGMYYHYGAGIYIEDASPCISNNIICRNWLPEVSGNTIVIEGGGIFAGHPLGGAWACCPVIRGNVIYDNFSGGHGGGVAIVSPCLDEPLLIEDNLIYANRAGSNGGGIYLCQFAHARVINNQVFDNKGWNGGGIYGWSYFVPDGTMVLRNNLIHNNTADNWGGALSLHFMGILSVNNTYADNRALMNGGGVYLESCKGRMVNDILWGNMGEHLGDQGFLQSFSQIRVQHADIEAKAEGFHVTATSALDLGRGIVTINPLFNPGFQNYHIMALSPCKNAGKNSVVGPTITDFEGQRRIYDHFVDIGADEYQP